MQVFPNTQQSTLASAVVYVGCVPSGREADVSSFLEKADGKSVSEATCLQG